MTCLEDGRYVGVEGPQGDVAEEKVKPMWDQIT